MSKFAVAVHPIQEMYAGAQKHEIQEVLDEPGRISIGINFAQFPGEKPTSLYVNPKITLETRLPTLEEIANARPDAHFYSIFNPEDAFMPHQVIGDELDIVLVGGEVNAGILAGGCHLSALLDIKHFIETNPHGITTARLKIPFNALFTVTSQPFDRANLAAFDEQYGPHSSEYSRDANSANIVLRRKRPS